MLKLISIVCLFSLAYGDWDQGWNNLLNNPNARWQAGNCPEISQRPFQAERYFNGQWYLRSSWGNYLAENNQNTCSYIQYLREGNQLQYRYFQSQPGSHQYQSLRGSIDLNEVHGSTYQVRYENLHGIQNAVIPYTVLETDYDNYAVVYSCKEVQGNRLELVWGLTRQRGLGQWDNAISNGLTELRQQRQGWNSLNLALQENDNCPRNWQ